MTKERVCANTPGMSRRTILAALLASCAALALPDVASASEATPMMRLFREWQELGSACDAGNLPDFECDAIALRMLRLEDEMCATPSQTAADLAAKVIALTSGNFFELPSEPDHPFWQEVSALAGHSVQF